MLPYHHGYAHQYDHYGAPLQHIAHEYDTLGALSHYNAYPRDYVYKNEQHKIAQPGRPQGL